MATLYATLTPQNIAILQQQSHTTQGTSCKTHPMHTKETERLFRHYTSVCKTTINQIITLKIQKSNIVQKLSP